MYSKKNHIQTAHNLWKELLLPHDNAIDATCGNGKDSLFLTECITQGKIFCFDIQETALEKTKKLLQKKSPKSINNILFIKSSHENFSLIEKHLPIKLVVYNLGYLPGGNKDVTTQTESTIKSIKKAFNIISPGGAVSITCYPGHPEGAKETIAVIKLLSDLDEKYKIVKNEIFDEITKPKLFFVKKPPLA